MNLTAEIPATIIQDQLDDVLREATGAVRGVPSSDAWSWRATYPLIELLADPRLGTDPRQRTVLLDAGAGLLNLRVLIKGRGVHPVVRLHPDPTRPDLVATVRLEGRRLVTEQDRALLAALLTGTPGQPPEPTGPLITAFRRAARTEQAWVAIRPHGVLPAAGHASAHNGDAANQGGTALIIGTVLDGPSARVQAGQAAQRVTLTAATHGVSVTAAMRDLLETETHRRAVRDLIGGGLWPQAVLHLDTDLPHPGTRAH